MNTELQQLILEAADADAIDSRTTIQGLWSGYGSIDRYHLSGAGVPTVIVKHVRLPQRSNHPRGWDGERSHRRKLRSYHIEAVWYQDWSGRCDERCRVPRCLALEQLGDEQVMVLEDLDSAGFPARHTALDDTEIGHCLSWLAHFHARFIGAAPRGLWSVGSYWHLATRPDELAAIEDRRLRQAAAELDRMLSAAPYQTLIHGDAKLATSALGPMVVGSLRWIFNMSVVAAA